MFSWTETCSSVGKLEILRGHMSIDRYPYFSSYKHPSSTLTRVMSLITTNIHALRQSSFVLCPSPHTTLVYGTMREGDLGSEQASGTYFPFRVQSGGEKCHLLVQFF